jgi:hypothetical protein
MNQRYTFKTHTTLFSTTEPHFDSSFTRLSESSGIRRWLSGAGSELSLCSKAGEFIHRTLHSGAVILVTKQDDVWVLDIPRNDE